ncbi:hypothetical protein [Phenylobacterium soli]|uniref:hypothetical protein n=1 Tax=Phenylobacterium soli TaxID=2170551 RepID=UPI001057F0A5|nr:hypothetical protein [Phenylobacterium soli]
MDVVVRTEARAELEAALSWDDCAELYDLVRRYARHGSAETPPRKLSRKVGWRRDGVRRGEPPVLTFRATAAHLFGVVFEATERPTLVFTGVDLVRKNDNARPELLEAAGLEALRVKGLLDR